MALWFFSTGILGIFFCTAFQNSLDNRLPDLIRKIAAWAERFLRPPNPSTEDAALISHLVASIRGGSSLDSALESAALDQHFHQAKFRLQKISQGNPPGDFLSQFLAEALQSGIPVLCPLLSFQKILQTERRVRLKANALTSQCRAQGEVLSWLPWILLVSLAVIDADWFFTSLRSSLAWLLWSGALLLVAVGRSWMKNLLQKALAPGNWEETLQEVLLPELTLRLISQLALGIDAESSLEKCLEKMGHARLLNTIKRRNEQSANAFLHLVEHAASTGAPLRQDLELYLEDLQLQIESRWETRVQRLPVVMMAPLFLCFFPGSLLVLLALLLPLLAGGFS